MEKQSNKCYYQLRVIKVQTVYHYTAYKPETHPAQLNGFILYSPGCGLCLLFVQTVLMKVCLFVQRWGLHLRTASYRQQRKPVQDSSLPSRRAGQTGRGVSAVEMLSRDPAQRPGVKNLPYDIHIIISHIFIHGTHSYTVCRAHRSCVRCYVVFAI